MKINVDMMCLISSIVDKMEIDTSVLNSFFEEGKKANGKSKEDKEVMQQQLGAQLILEKLKKALQEVLVKEEIIQFICLYKNIQEEEAKKVDIIGFIKELAKDEGLISFLRLKAMSE